MIVADFRISIYLDKTTGKDSPAGKPALLPPALSSSKAGCTRQTAGRLGPSQLAMPVNMPPRLTRPHRW